ncbi:MAG: hypothetical protein R3C03_02675 [Pirellulaceae bacterium]
MFIAGMGEGGNAAFDIGIAHPDIFAGVCGISGKIIKYPEIYKKNEHLGLSVLAIVGDKDYFSRNLSENVSGMARE